MGKLIRPSKIPKIIREERRISMAKDLRKKINIKGEDILNKFLFKGETLDRKLEKNASSRAEFAKAKEVQKQQKEEKQKEERPSIISRRSSAFFRSNFVLFVITSSSCFKYDDKIRFNPTWTGVIWSIATILKL